MNAFLLGPLLFAALAVAVVTDLRARRIPNWLTLPTLIVALLLRGLLGGWDGAGGLWQGLVGMGVAFVPFFALALAGGMGMGDVKLVAAVGACLGGQQILPALFCIAVVGGVQGVVALARSGGLRRLGQGEADRKDATQAPARTPITVPYGVAIALGTVWSVFWPPWGGV